MPLQTLISQDDLLSRIYRNNLEEITRDDENLCLRAIQAAVAEAKMYLNRYDTDVLLGTEDAPPTHIDAYLQQLCIQIAVWYLVLLGNPGVDFNSARSGYDSAITALRDIQAFRIQPEDWPYRDTSADTTPEGSAVSASYINKRNNDF